MAISLKDIKNEISKAGTNRGKIFYLKEGSKARIRFLTDFERGTVVVFHDKFGENINVPCQEHFNRPCPYCDDDSLRTRNFYAWSIYDYESKEVKIFMFAINQCSPLPSLASMFETYKTITDRDFEIKRTGSKTNTVYSLVPLDKMKFRSEKSVKPLSEQAILKYIDKAYPCDSGGGEDDELPFEKEEKKSPTMNEPEEEESGDDWDEDEKDYASMSPKDLYKLCISKGIDCDARKSKEYYIALLEDDDDWGED